MKSLFYEQAYLDIQNHKELEIFEDDCFKIVFAFEGGIATSVPKGLFGSFMTKQSNDPIVFNSFLIDIEQQLKLKGISKLVVTHPINIYEGFVPIELLRSRGFSVQTTDVNHHVDVGNYQFHQMQLRKLRKLNQTDFKIQEIENARLKEVYDFIKRCREEKDLVINIEFDKLQLLFDTFPTRYKAYVGVLEDVWISALVTVQVSDKVMYYYLPASLNAYKEHSAMVTLVKYVLDKNQDKAQFLDLGISSINGVIQQGLVDFKERIGGISSNKTTLMKNI